jgi:hypothetical protein
MKRILLIAALCLFGSLPVKALVLHNGESVTIGGDFSSNPFENLVYFSIHATVDGDLRRDYPFPQFLVSWQANGGISASGGFPGGGGFLTLCGGNIPGPGACYGQPSQSTGYINADNPVITAWTGFHSAVYPSDPVQSPFGLPYSSDITIEVGVGPNLFFITPVPEPSTWAMMLLGFAALGGLLRLKNANRRVEIEREILA